MSVALKNDEKPPVEDYANKVRQQSQKQFEPRIIGLVCNWCSYAGADLAGTSRAQYPPNIRLVRVMCSGAVDPLYILRPIIDGADGVLVGG
jgi:hypothetical protein